MDDDRDDTLFPTGDAALVVVAITGAFLCDSCITRKTGVSERDVVAAVAEIGKTMKIVNEFARCGGCLRADLVSRLG